MINLLAAISVVLMSVPSDPPARESEDTLSASVITVSKMNAVLVKAASPVISIDRFDVQRKDLNSPKRLSSLVPNLHIPEYGSAMTSSIYARGFGSRMENPSIGLYVDEIPVLDKNMFDTDFLDVARIDYVSGPQATLFGRNSMVGVLSVSTLPAFDELLPDGAVSLTYGSFGTIEASGLWHKGRVVASAKAFHTNGMYKNSFDGSRVDDGNGGSFRLRYSPRRRAGRSSDYSLWASYLNQGGWPYRQLKEDGSIAPINYNDVCNYERLAVLAGANEGFKVGRNHDLKSITSLQVLLDRMKMDQDFTDASMFTLKQRQRQVALTEELIFRPSVNVDWWDSQSGLFIFSKYNKMHAPVHFLHDGIDQLILGNANAHIPSSIGKLDFSERDFVIGSDFDLFYQNAALYHESYFNFGKWRFTAGVRLDYEYQHMSYDSRATIHYALLPRMTEYRELNTVFQGSQNNSWLQFVPKVAARYGTDYSYWFASASKGFRAGGFNTQIFSDILQNRLTGDLMNGLGVHVDGMGKGLGASSTAYKPEESWNFELGGRTSIKLGRKAGYLTLSASVFDIECRNQQITVFPAGKNTGRMMANAGQSRSYGAEMTARWNNGTFNSDLRFGWSHATFTKYNDNIQDYSGKFIPYAPTATWHYGLGCTNVNIDYLTEVDLYVYASGCGKIWWNEDNTLAQDPYCLLGADITFKFEGFDLFAHATNILNKDYSVFCFKSVGNSFLQKGRPRCVTGGIRIKF